MRGKSFWTPCFSGNVFFDEIQNSRIKHFFLELKVIESLSYISAIDGKPETNVIPFLSQVSSFSMNNFQSSFYSSSSEIYQEYTQCKMLETIIQKLMAFHRPCQCDHECILTILRNKNCFVCLSVFHLFCFLNSPFLEPLLDVGWSSWMGSPFVLFFSTSAVIPVTTRNSPFFSNSSFPEIAHSQFQYLPDSGKITTLKGMKK